MSYLDHDGLAYFKSKLDRTFIADIVFDDGDILLYGGDGTLLKTVVQEGTVTQKKSTANKEYPILLCWDADAEEDQTMKTVWYGLDARINPKYGYLYARRYYTEHPSYERTEVPSVRAEWHHIFTDAVSAPMGEVYEYLDRATDGGEHRMELRLYGNPLSQYVDTPNHNEATDAVSLGVGATRGEKLTFFGYAPSTPIYLEDGTTIRKSTVRGDQYGKDIITRDWLNLNGSITGLVHTYMDETIDGYKTFLKTVTIDSGNDNAKAGLNVQGDVNIDSGDNTKPSNLYVQGNSHIHGNEDIDGNLNVDGTSTLDGNVHMKHNLDVDGNLNVDGTSDQHGNVHMYSNLDVDGNANTDGNQTIGGTLTVTGKITGNGGAEISGGNGLKVNGTTTTDDLTVTDDAIIGDSLTVAGDILKKNGNTTQNYFEYATTNSTIKNTIVNNIIKNNGGLAVDSNNEIYVKLKSGGGIVNDSGFLKVDFTADPNDPNAQQIMEQTKAAILSGLNIKIPLTSDRTFYVNKDHTNATTVWKTNKGILDISVGTSSKPFKTIQSAVDCITQSYDINEAIITIIIVKGSTDYNEAINLPLYSRTTGYIKLESANKTSSSNFSVISSSQTANGTDVDSTVYVIGNGWNLSHLHIKRTSTLITDGQNHYDSAIVVDDKGILTINNCLITHNYSGNAASAADISAGINCTFMRTLAVYDQSQVLFISESAIDTVITANKGNGLELQPFFAERSAQINTFSHSKNSYSKNIYINGTGATAVLTSIYNSQIACITGQTYVLNIIGNITGPSCKCSEGGSIYLFNDIGTAPGTCEASTFSWVKPSSLLE